MAQDTLSLAGKVAIVTGSGRESGIGAAIAFIFARNGARVTINHVSDASAPRATNVAKVIQAQGGAATVIQADISTQEGAAKLVQGTLAAFGVDHVDILVNNAAGGAPKSALQSDREALDTIFQSIVYGPIFTIQATLPHMPRGGRIVNIGSIASKLGMSPSAVYGAAKAAQDSLTYALAMELGRGHGVTINTVAPGPVDTEALPKMVAEKIHETLIPMTRAEERAGTQEDIADAVLLLVSEKSRWITGQIISVSGGITGGSM
ncbi:hypothetical protein N7468_008424 [Penicillium chermesinum]|uniref:Uncharacterized protein n=1 Tax=Penicillium chermesinum TaxID=63820 RepID=A0A9W9NPT6_9EURO|nr:uncharacterized protein N7468_008424 [Penicillium chermesinum]KAJ5223882.1 hypothetical protein N7468_008424 [Penicillium chermesinum]KAJ6155294.1 hypothetical protein N7470_005860 [Penicillium chermesinum]